jgi:pyruvate/2-oxoglutarate dehydrogenase complex dihydrolipoamide dehydrogenase (E3) component
MPEQFDAIVIGTGQAGPSLAARLASAGRKTAIIERLRFGGTCVNVGCIPTKTLIASARAAHVARRGSDFGVMIDGAIKVDMRKVKARKDAVVAQSSTGVEKWLKNTRNLAVIEGHARFTSPTTVQVGERLLESGQIFINTGGRAVVPDIPGIIDVPHLNNSTVMEVDFLPEHLLIIGGSYIGLEFAQMYRRFGSQVTVIETGPRLVAREDPEVSEAIRDILAGEGIAFHLGARDLRLSRQGEAVNLLLATDAGAQSVTASHLLLATGRRPNTDDLGLEHTGITLDGRGYIPVDDQLRTSVPGIWALGDVNGRGAFTHTSYNDYEIVAANLLGNEPRKVSDRIPAYALFIDPPLGRVGMSEAEVRKHMAQTGGSALVATRPMTRVGRANERGETAGFMKVLVDAGSKKILGASLLGIEGDEAIHSILDVMYAGAPYTTITHAVHIHPTVSELIPTLLGDLKPLA